MKKLFFIIWILVGVLLEQVSGQNLTPYTIGSGGDTKTIPGSYFMGQPFAGPGDQSVGLGHFLWFPTDSTFRYNVGDIPDKSVFHNASCRFRIFWVEHPEAAFSFSLSGHLDTAIVLEQEDGTAIFEYTPLEADYSSFTVEFTAIDSEDTARQGVTITPGPALKPQVPPPQ